MVLTLLDIVPRVGAKLVDDNVGLQTFLSAIDLSGRCVVLTPEVRRQLAKVTAMVAPMPTNALWTSESAGRSRERRRETHK